ncbi:hypothetical protein CANARDRAFT_192857 [[Candida] arabinofermentans NRRL YB-2248]|uniref:peptide chain release factor N(5)-glutamine methyltransferase n=1 Tax=[Candida] arabinofermentans NRRL YB-2248 TaxID=983967 RepID=A0A1E4T874_9ASCO|nr:hypothetical protein CANARDRAFT_192857 [[Candida] arabinofermentans NRRL YB-2248]
MKLPSTLTPKNLLSILTKSLPEEQAAQELRWIQQELPSSSWLEAVIQRSNYKPLQYILGTQPFGNLELNCKEGVLIPRNDTEEWCIELQTVLKETKLTGLPNKLNVLDYCTGTGCIALSLAENQLADIVNSVTAVDYNPLAITLSQENLIKHRALVSSDVNFVLGDLLKRYIPPMKYDIDLLVSNPPYIPKQHLNIDGGVEQSVLQYEPQDALLGDLEFYDALADMAVKLKANAFVFELGYLKQAFEVKEKLNYYTGVGNTWQCGIRYDSGGGIRNVVGWRHKDLRTLGKMCHEMI